MLISHPGKWDWKACSTRS